MSNNFILIHVLYFNTVFKNFLKYRIQQWKGQKVPKSFFLLLLQPTFTVRDVTNHSDHFLAMPVTFWHDYASRHHALDYHEEIFHTTRPIHSVARFWKFSGWRVAPAAALVPRQGIFFISNFQEDMRQNLGTDWMDPTVVVWVNV